MNKRPDDNVIHYKAYRRFKGDPAAIDRYLKAERGFIEASRELQAEGEAEAIDDSAVAAAVADHPSGWTPTTVPQPSRGPWVLEVTGLGRPLTFNAERTSSMSAATWRKVREQAEMWKDAVEQQARAANIPPLKRAFVVVQPFYPDNRVPDTDALPSAVKAGLDGLVRAGVLPNDRRQETYAGYHMLGGITDGGEPRLTVTVFPLP